MIKFLDLRHQYDTIKKEMDNAINGVISNSAFIGGEEIKKLERDFGIFQNAGYCIAVANGTDALEIAIEALNLPKNSEIIVPANSFIASSEAVTRTGHKVVFCDCDERNYTLSIESVKKVITANTSALMAVHLYGHPCNMEALLEIANEYGLKIIEDCAQAHGAEFEGKRVGAIGDIGTFSFYPGKNLGAYGDGGAIVTNNGELAKKCRMIANHGRIEKYNHEFEGRNSRLDNLQAAVLNVKLKHLEKWTNRRIEIAEYYSQSLTELSSLTLPIKEIWARQVYHLFVIRVKERENLQQFLKERGIQSGIHYPIALPKLGAYKYLGKDKADFKANKFDSQLLSIPIGEHMNLEDAKEVVETLKEYDRLNEI